MTDYENEVPPWYMQDDPQDDEIVSLEDYCDERLRELAVKWIEIDGPNNRTRQAFDAFIECVVARDTTLRKRYKTLADLAEDFQGVVLQQLERMR